jgi:hypothetical protein
MPSTLAGFGLQPAYHPSGTLRPTIYPIVTGYATGILSGQPVKLNDGAIEAAAVGDRFIGTFMGVSWTDTDGIRRFSNQWTASTAGTDIQATVTLDPAITYNIQADATMDATTVGAQYDFNIASGSTTTGLSSMTLDVASIANNASLRVVGLTPGPNNAWGDTYPIVQVQISEHQNVADVADY